MKLLNYWVTLLPVLASALPQPASRSGPDSSAPRASLAPPSSDAPGTQSTKVSSNRLGSSTTFASSQAPSSALPSSTIPPSGQPSTSSSFHGGVPSSQTQSSSLQASNTLMPSSTLLSSVASPSDTASSSTPPIPQSSSGVKSSVPTSSTAEQTLSSTSITTSASALATWHINMEVGSGAFFVGDCDSDDPDCSSFRDLWDNACSSTGCDPDATQKFSWTGPLDKGDYANSDQSSTFTLEGSVDDSDDITGWILDAINAAMQAGKQCSIIDAEGGGGNCIQTCSMCPPNCTPEPVNVCTMPDYIQATVYDESHSQKAQITVRGSTNVDGGEFPCGEVEDVMSVALAPFSSVPGAGAIPAVFDLICQHP